MTPRSTMGGDMTVSSSGWKAAALAAVCMLSSPTLASAQATKAGVVTTLQGTATVARAAGTQPAPLRFKDDVFEQDHIVTGESSIVRILLGGKAVVTVRERSALTIHETPTTSTIEIGSGKIALAVAKDRMKPGESVQIKTPNAMAGVRGTVVIADVTAPHQPGGAVTTRFTLLTGLVDVARLDGTGQPSGQVVMLHPLQSITVTGLMPPGAVRTLTRAEAQAVAGDYKVTLPAPPPPANVQVTEQQIEIAVQHSVALTGGQSGKGVPTTERARNNDHGESDETGSASPSTVTVGTGGTSGGGFGANAGATLGNTASVNAGVSAGGGTVSAGTNVAVGGGAVGAGLGVSVGGGGINAGTNVAVGGGAIGAGGSVTVGGGGVGAGVGVGVGGIGAGGSVTVGGGGVGAGVGVGAGGIGAGGGVGVGGGGLGVGGTVAAGGLGAGVGVGVGVGGVTGGVTVPGVGGVTVGGGGVGVTVPGGGGVTVGGGGSSGTGGSGGGGLLGGLVPKVLPLK
jgi:hypothetical protein